MTVYETEEGKAVLRSIKNNINQNSHDCCERSLALNFHDLPNMTKEECMRVGWKMAIAWALPRISVE